MTESPEPIVRLTLTVGEVAVALGISRTTAYECVHRGEIPSRRFGRRIVVLRHELARLLDAGPEAQPDSPDSPRTQ